MTPPSPPDPTVRLSRAAWLTLAAAFFGWMLDGVEQGIFPLIARPALQQMLHMDNDQLVGQWMGWLTAIWLIGAAFGGFLFGWLGDRIGRVRAMSYSILVYSVFTGLTYFATQPWHLGALRLIASLGLGGQWALGVALVMETWPEHLRPWLAGAIGAAANVGYVLLGLLTMYIPVTRDSWRWLMLVGSAPALLTYFIRWYVPESEKWSASVDANSETPAQPLRDLLDRGVLGRTLIGITVSSIALIGTWGSIQWVPLWVDQLANGDPRPKAVSTALLAGGAIFGCFAGSLLAKYGRRLAYAIICLTAYASCWVMYHRTSPYGMAFYTIEFIAGAFTTAFYGWIPLYLPELFPTRVRATAQGVSYNAGRILAAVGAISAGQLVAYYHGSYARMGLTIILIYLVGAAVVWLAPETKGKPLPA